jgi:hypothetical protein
VGPPAPACCSVAVSLESLASWAPRRAAHLHFVAPSIVLPTCTNLTAHLRSAHTPFEHPSDTHLVQRIVVLCRACRTRPLLWRCSWLDAARAGADHSTTHTPGRPSAAHTLVATSPCMPAAGHVFSGMAALVGSYLIHRADRHHIRDIHACMAHFTHGVGKRAIDRSHR